MKPAGADPCLSRRSFLLASAQLTAGMLISIPLFGQASPVQRHRLSLYHTHTGETLKVDFHPAACSPRTVQRINRFLRDHRTGEVFPIDLRLLEMLCRIQKAGGSSGTFEVISGYRSQRTNNRLRQKSSGVATKSLHLQGQAIDVRLTDLKTRKLKDIAQSLQAGGVGFYAASNFVHLDTGRVRSW
jgi:uncharacterized protein YcbK (DUF882 family)